MHVPCLPTFSLISKEVPSKTVQSHAKVLSVMASLISEAAVSPPTPSVFLSSICLDFFSPFSSLNILFTFSSLSGSVAAEGLGFGGAVKNNGTVCSLWPVV